MLIAATLLLSSLVAAPASQVYKCRMPNGVLSFQAKPCPAGTHLKTLVVPLAPEAPGGTAAARPAVPAATAPAEPPPQASALPVAAYYRCTRHDDSTYYSASAYPRRARIDSAALADPALAKASAGGGQVWVEDDCTEVPLREACDWYEQQIGLVAAQQRVASGLELKKLVTEHQRLSTIRGARCRPR